MKLKLFCFPLSEESGLDSREMDEFLQGKEVIDYQKDILIYKNRPYYSLLVFYQGKKPDYLPSQVKSKKEKVEPKLSEREKAVFDLLRRWRKKRSEELGYPPYIILTNRELIEVVKVRPQSLAQLEKIKGIGENKVKNYGGDILEILRENCHPPTVPVEEEDGKT